MSFNARLPPSGPGFNPGSSRGNRARFTPRGPVKTEDAQPNELLKKRNVAGPPVIRASVPIPRSRGRGRGAFARGRGASRPAPSIPHNTTWTGAQHNQAESASSEMQAGPSRLGTELDGRTHRAKVQPSIPASLPPDTYAQHRGFYETAPTTYRAERSNDGKPLAPPHPHRRSYPGPEYGSLTAVLNQKHALEAMTAPNLPSSVPAHEKPDIPAAPPRSLPPLPRRQILFPDRRETPPHLSSLQRGAIPASEAAKPSKIDPAAGRPTMPAEPSGSRSTASSSNIPPASTQPHGNTTKPAKALASASDILLSDLHRPEAPADMSRSHLPPPPKRRRISLLSAQSPSPPLALGRVTSHAPPLPRNVLPPAAPHTAVHHQQSQAKAPTAPVQPVKRERSSSPTIDTNPSRLVTEGCVRIAPLPPDCKSGRPGHKEARKIWTAREVKKLRDLGVQPTRIFVREDGMVIDWQSSLPVMSDTLRPPPTATANSSEGVSRHSSPGTPLAKKPRLQTAPISEGPPRTEHANEARSAAEHSPPPRTQRTAPHGKRKDLPAPGETIWKTVLPPSRPPQQAARGGNSSASTGPRARSRPPSPGVGPATSGQHAGGIIDLTDGDQPAVEVIDLTDEPGGWFGEQPDPVVTLPASASSPPPHRDTPPTSSSRAHVTRSRSPDTTSPTSQQYTGDVAAPRGPPLHAGKEEMEEAAISFLQRYVGEFLNDRAALASAYSRSATFSAQTLPPPLPRSADPAGNHGSSSAGAINTPTAHHCGRVDIIAALLDLPELDTSSDRQTVEWDLVHAQEAGDVLLVFFVDARIPGEGVGSGSARTKGKGKEKAGGASPSPNVRGLCEQRFILRSREWDEEDRSTPGVWPVVAVAHQMLFRPLPC